MADIEQYKSRLTQVSADIFDNFEKTGEDDMFFLGKIASGEIKGVIVSDLIHRAQVFANPDFRGRICALKGFSSMNIPVVDCVKNGSLKGLVNNRFTSYVVADSKIGLSDLRESYASTSSKSFHLTSLQIGISDVEDKLSEVAKSILIPQKNVFSKSRGVPFVITKKQSSNSLCVLMDEIYQVAEKKISGEFHTELEKSTATILATWLVSRALDFSCAEDKNNTIEKKLDEAMKLQFYTHLNGCFNGGNCEISKIVKSGTSLAISLIEELGYGIEDIQQKYGRLDMSLENSPNSIFEALFGKKHVAESIMNVVDEEIISREPDIILSLENAKGTSENDSVRVDEKLSEISATPAAPVPSTAPAILLSAPISKSLIEQIQKSSERTVKDGECVHGKGNVVNHKTVKSKFVKTLVNICQKKMSTSSIRAEKFGHQENLMENNFWIGAQDGIKGLARKESRTSAYSEGYNCGYFYGESLNREIDMAYSPDKKKLIVDVEGKGAAATKNLADNISKHLGAKNFEDFVKKVVASLSEVFQTFKNHEYYVNLSENNRSIGPRR